MDTKAQVFFLPWKRRAKLSDLLEQSQAARLIHEGDFVAIKMHFGEKGNDGYIRPKYVEPVIKMIRAANARPFLTDTGTIYSGPRKDAIGHLEVAAEHGFSIEAMGVPIIIADGLRGMEFEEVEVNGKHFKRALIAAGIRGSHAMIALSHFKGHILAGFGGALKNLGMGCGSRKGKFEMHSSMPPQIDAESCIACGACAVTCSHGAITMVNGAPVLDIDKCVGCGECAVICPVGAITIETFDASGLMQERFVEYAAGAAKDKRCFFVNFLNHITPNCDCMSRGEKPLVPDIGILASSDPVAIDQASYDLVFKAGGDVFEKAHRGIDGTVQLAYGEKMGLGKREYEIIDISRS